MEIIFVRRGLVYRVVETHQEVDYAPDENPQPEELQEGIDYIVKYAVARCEGCHDPFYEYELRSCLPDGTLLCAMCAENGR